MVNIVVISIDVLNCCSVVLYEVTTGRNQVVFRRAQPSVIVIVIGAYVRKRSFSMSSGIFLRLNHI